ncbi:Late embryogenesis abundant (LEA) hydroxyproline-rich glycoprotein family [Trema orientale]|uniref:Late embryogenesis abundant (LEA) hydroxyproline-rich glycoprotein family n=1 Tax=Trema orientale TaxID=63057 RepID=A0A2P5EGJ1_TREOI|nr:Late embryogenesis abundant (LEA) hydroxyproline-rich glycoprotein family [Trema orientale]
MESGHKKSHSKFSDIQGSLPSPQHRQNVPQVPSPSDQKSGSSFLSRYLCCLYCCIFLVVFVAVLLACYLYTMYKPQIPTYGIDNLSVKTFNLMKDSSLSTEFDIVVRATNPNEHISLVYRKDSSVVVTYSDSELCSGKLPVFRQQVLNATLMKLVLKGESEFRSGLQKALMDNRQAGNIPLIVRLKVPVSIVLWGVPLRQIVVHVDCSLEVDNLHPGKKTKILYSDYSYDVRV